MATNGAEAVQQPLPHRHVGVVGAGIAGLSAAIALRRAGWHVEVFEKSWSKNETGAAITVTPNAALVLARWGFDMETAGAVPNESRVLSLASDPTVVLDKQEYAGNEHDTWGYGVWSLHRVDLHRELRHLATMSRGDIGAGPPVQIRLGCEVQGVDCEQGILRMRDGQSIIKDLIVIADGAHVSARGRKEHHVNLLTESLAQSHLISEVAGHPSKACRTGRSLYRWLVSMEDVMREADLREIYSRDRPGFVAFLDPDRDIFWMTYRCRGGKLLNIVVSHDTHLSHDEEGPWNLLVSSAQALATVEGSHGSLKKMVLMASEDGIHYHHQYTRSPLTTFVRGRTLAVGDAAHVMKPTHAAGAGVAIESAAALEVLFRGVDSRNNQAMQQRLQMFDELRIPRCNLTMMASRGRRWLQEPGVEEEVRRFYSGPLPPPDAPPYSKAGREVLFHHDEYQAAEKLLAQALNPESRPTGG